VHHASIETDVLMTMTNVECLCLFVLESSSSSSSADCTAALNGRDVVDVERRLSLPCPQSVFLHADEDGDLYVS